MSLLERLSAPVSEVMTREVATLSPETTVEQAARDMIQNRVTGMPVVGYDGSVVGVLSLTDVAVALAGEGPSDPPVPDDAAFFDPVKLDHLVRSLDADDDAASGKSVADSMSRRLVVSADSATVAEAAAMMARFRVHRVLITDAAGKLAGILTSMDVVAIVGGP